MVLGFFSQTIIFQFPKFQTQIITSNYLLLNCLSQIVISAHISQQYLVMILYIILQIYDTIISNFYNFFSDLGS